jgi:hypothetical protein
VRTRRITPPIIVQIRVSKIVVEETHLEILSALRQLVGSKLLSQLWNGFERLSFGIHYGVGLIPNLVE